MRLIKTDPYISGAEKLEMIQKWGDEIPPYAILSHTWSTEPDDEVLLADVKDGTCSTKPAFPKLQKAMERANVDGHKWLWIDTCCIDKTSSVELSEAINSMYKYYRDCQTCYAFLGDVNGEKDGVEFTISHWWERGWTLQELLAPRQVEFYDGNWHRLGSKLSLQEQIARRTGIDTDYLTGVYPVEHASVAKRMSWQSERRTTREEDIAYSMLGIFDVNMPMLYGEGAIKAFLRLQEEIMKSSEDQSLFAWVQDKDTCATSHGLLADSPRDFTLTGHIVPYSDIGEHNTNPQALTARGLHLTLHLTTKPDGTYVAALNCPNPSDHYGEWLAVYLRKLNTGKNQYVRVACHIMASVPELGFAEAVYVVQKFQIFNARAIYPNNYLQLRSLNCTSDYADLCAYRITGAKRAHLDPASHTVRNAPRVPKVPWCSMPLVYGISTTPGTLTAALLIRRTHDEEQFVLIFGVDSDHNLVAEVHGADIFELTAEEISDALKPRRLGECMDLEFHTICVRAETQVRDNKKIWLIDIDIQAFPKAPTINEIAGDAIDSVLSPMKSVARMKLKEKMRRRIKFVN